jgi:uncharacterized protein YqeY
MELQKQISADLVTAMKTKDTTTLNTLRVLKGEIQRAEQSPNGKVELSDGDIIKLIKKSIDGINETGGNQDEVLVLEKYMPKQMNLDDVISLVKILIDENNYNSPKDMGKIMAHFSQNFAGQYDGKLLSEIVKKELSNSNG